MNGGCINKFFMYCCLKNFSINVIFIGWLVCSVKFELLLGGNDMLYCFMFLLNFYYFFLLLLFFY